MRRCSCPSVGRNRSANRNGSGSGVLRWRIAADTDGRRVRVDSEELELVIRGHTLMAVHIAAGSAPAGLTSETQ